MGLGFRVRAAVVALVLCHLGLVGFGCNPGDRPIAVRGKVTFQSEPVTEGLVQFNDEKTGHGAEADLGPDGSYQVRLAAGAYTVIILPPLLSVESKNSPPDLQFKKVRNIPNKYRNTGTSGLTAAVSADKTVHDFAMKP